MARGVSKKEKSFAIAIIVAIVLVGSLLLFLIPSPEQVVGTSDDGLVHMEGVSRVADGFVIKRIDDAELSVAELVGPMYEVSVLGGGSVQDVEVVFSVEEFETPDVTLQNMVVYEFDHTSLTWKPLPTLFHLSDHTVFSSMSVSGSTLVGLGVRVQAE